MVGTHTLQLSRKRCIPGSCSRCVTIHDDGVDKLARGWTRPWRLCMKKMWRTRQRGGVAWACQAQTRTGTRPLDELNKTETHTSFVNGLLGHTEHAIPTFPTHWQESTMYGYPMQGYGFRSGPPTSYQMPSGPVGPPQYQGYVQTNPQGGVMNGSTSRIH